MNSFNSKCCINWCNLFPDPHAQHVNLCRPKNELNKLFFEERIFHSWNSFFNYNKTSIKCLLQTHSVFISCSLPTTKFVMHITPLLHCFSKKSWLPHQFNPLTPRIWLLILLSSCYTFPCKLVARIWCYIKIKTFTWICDNSHYLFAW